MKIKNITFDIMIEDKNKNKIFIEKSNNIHKNKYDYSKSFYEKSTIKTCIICPEHGEFYQTPKDHLRGRGCPVCGKSNSIKSRTKTNDTFISECIKKHDNKYNYNNVIYINDKSKVYITCPEHGDFLIAPSHFLNGEGCRKCGIKNAAIKRTKDNLKFLYECRLSHTGETYDYSKAVYLNDKEKVCIICPEHGEFYQSPNNHISKSQGCPTCGREKTIESKKYTNNEWVTHAKDKHGCKYDYSTVNYIDGKIKVDIICHNKNKKGVEHGVFSQLPPNHLFGQGCPKCFKEKSGVESELCEFIRSLNIGFVENNRKILNGKEIDIYIPDKKIGIEMNGLIWHSELYEKDRKYHLNKTNDCEGKDIQLIHIFEDEWVYKKEIIKSRLRNIFLLNEIKIFARKCKVIEINSKETNQFINENHLQGAVNASVKIGLFYNEELVSVMTFGKQRKVLGRKDEEDTYEMLRFCNRINTTIIGGASKLLSYFIKFYNPEKIISYADRRWSQGKLYESLNFDFIRNTVPNYFYVVNKKREYRFKYRKDILVKQGFDPMKSEHEIMLERKIPRIYDCGSKLYELKIEK